MKKGGVGILKVRESLITGLREIYYNKTRSMLTLIGIMLGVASLIAMLSITSGIKKSMMVFLDQSGGLARVSVTPVDTTELQTGSGVYKSKGLTTEDVNLLIEKNSDIIDVIVPQVNALSGRPYATYEGKSFRLMNWFYGTTGEFSRINSLDVTTGRDLSMFDVETKSRVAVIGSIIQAELFGSNVNPIGKKISVNGASFAVVGLYSNQEMKQQNSALGGRRMPRSRTGGASSSSRELTPEEQKALNARMKEMEKERKKREKQLKKLGIEIPSRAIERASAQTKTAESSGRWTPVWQKYGDNQLWQKNVFITVPFTAFQQLYTQKSTLDSIEILFKDSEHLNDYVAAIKTTLRENRTGSATDDFEVNTNAEMFESANQQIRMMTLVFGAIAIISLLVGGIGIMNVILASISERIREIGVRKSVGASNVDIFVQFLIETVALSLIGGIIGVFAGIIASAVISTIAGMATYVAPSSILLALVSSGIIGIVFGIYPSLRAAKLNPIDALRYE